MTPEQESQYMPHFLLSQTALAFEDLEKATLSFLRTVQKTRGALHACDFTGVFEASWTLLDQATQVNQQSLFAVEQWNKWSRSHLMDRLPGIAESLTSNTQGDVHDNSPDQ